VTGQALALAAALGFGGLHPLDTASRDPDLGPSAQACRYCHEQEYRDWSDSRHRAAWTNAIFQEGFRREPERPCVHCHSPLTPAVRTRATGGRPHFDVAPGDAARGAECVNCIVSHVRDDAVMVANDPPYALHRTVVAPDLKDPAFCAGCHQFNWVRAEHGELVATRSPMQTTYDEYLAYRARGGEGTCQSCHMPSGRHLWHGAHDEAQLRRSLEVTVIRSGGRCRFTLASTGVGHAFPTGDVFRHLTLTVDGRERARFGREFALAPTASGDVDRVLTSDSALRPFEPVVVDVPCQDRGQFRVDYHFGGAQHHAPTVTLVERAY
jgi:hypothetical protein